MNAMTLSGRLSHLVAALTGSTPKMTAESQMTAEELLLRRYGMSDATFGPQVNRANILSYPPMFRCVNLVSGVIAWMISEGHLSVVDNNGDRVKSRRARRAVDIMTGLPNGREASDTFWKDAGNDYAIWGNSLLAIRRDSMFVPFGFERLSPRTATITQGSDIGNRMYTATVADDFNQRVDVYDRRDVIHSRWGRLGDSGPNELQFGMAQPPVTLMSRAIRIGIAAEIYTGTYFANDGGLKSKVAIGFDEDLNEEQMNLIDQQVDLYMKSRRPLTMPSKPRFTLLNESPQDAETSSLREMQVQETCRIYGVPSLLNGLNVTNWGQGIAELGRLAYRFGFRDHVSAMLAGCREVLLDPGHRFRVNEMILSRGAPKDFAGLIRTVQGDDKHDAILTETEIRQALGYTREPDGELRKATGSMNVNPPGNVQ